MAESAANSLSQRALEWTAKEFSRGRVTGKGIEYDGGNVRVVKAVSFKKNDGYAIRPHAKGWEVAAWTPVGFFSGLLNLAESIKCGQDAAGEVVPRFKSRLYKHESNLHGKGFHTNVGDLSENFWITYIKQLVRMQFNGLVFYPHYHPFEYFLDYNKFSKAVEQTAKAKRMRAKTLAGLKRAFGTAREFGLNTFMQHYVTHFPRRLAINYDINYPNPANISSGTRLSAYEHPIVDDYSRYIYRRTFELLPELTGMYFNFESAANSGDFIHRIVYPVFRKMKAPPQIVFRLWDFNSLPEMSRLVKESPSKVILGHKIMDRSDAYYYPKADPRVLEWKAALPKTEFMFLIGPCHNCGTIQSRLLWSDADFIYKLLDDMEKKGTDSFAFHTVFELLSDDVPIEKLAGEHEQHMSRFNRGHLDAVVDAVKGLKPDEKRTAARYAERLGLSGADARKLTRLMKNVSQISMLTLQQHFWTSSKEGYLFPSYRSTYQDPYYYLNEEMANREPYRKMSLMTAWLNRNLKKKNIPPLTKLLIDAAAPGAGTELPHPAELSRRLLRYGQNALKAAESLRKKYSAPDFDTLLKETVKMADWAEHEALNIQVGLGVYPMYYGISRQKALSGLKKAIGSLTTLKKLLRKADPGARHLGYILDEPDPAADLKILRALAGKIEKGGFPWKAFQEYCVSLERYSMLRREVRPDRMIPPATARKIKRLLSEARKHAIAALEALGKNKYSKNVSAWLAYLDDEFAAVKPPVMEAPLTSKTGDDEGFILMRHDQCFRFGENVLEDFLGFFRPRDWFRRRPLFFRITRNRNGLVVSFEENGVDMAARRKHWKQYKGTGDDLFCYRIYVDREAEGRKQQYWYLMHEAHTVRHGDIKIIGRQHTQISLEEPFTVGESNYRKNRDGYRLDFMIPWKALGGKPKQGDAWKVQLTANPYITRNTQYCWCAAYETRMGKTDRMGTVIFK